MALVSWKPGQSGNPAGRPRGSRNKVTKYRAELEARGTAVIATIIERALDGDMQAARLVIERISPPIRAQASQVRFDLPDGDLSVKASAILDAVAGGHVSVDVGKTLVDTLAGIARIVEITELEARLVALEEAHHAT